MGIEWRAAAIGVAVLAALTLPVATAGADCGASDDPAEGAPARDHLPLRGHGFGAPVATPDQILVERDGHQIGRLGTFGFRRLYDFGGQASGITLAGGRRVTAAWHEGSGDHVRLRWTEPGETPVDLGPSLSNGHRLEVLVATDGGRTILEQGSASRLHDVSGDRPIAVSVPGTADAVRGPAGLHVVGWLDGRDLVIARYLPGQQLEEVGRLPGWSMASATIGADGSLEAAVTRRGRLARFTAPAGRPGRLQPTWLRAAQVTVATVSGRLHAVWTRARHGRQALYSAPITGSRPRARRLLRVRGRLRIDTVADDGRGRPVVAVGHGVHRPTRSDPDSSVWRLMVARPGRRAVRLGVNRRWDEARAAGGMAVDARRRIHVLSYLPDRECGGAPLNWAVHVVRGRSVATRPL